MNECAQNHPKVWYKTTACPVCEVIDREIKLIDDKEDIDQVYIKDLDKRIQRLERVVFPEKLLRRFWSTRDKIFKEEMVNEPATNLSSVEE